MKKAIVLARFDDYCTKKYMDRVLATTTHKMSLNVDDELKDRPIYRRIREVHESMYVAAMAMDSKVKYVVCDYLPHNEVYKQVMVLSKCFIKKNAVLYDVGGHHFPISKELIIPGVNDFSLLYSGKANKKEEPHLLLGPISFVNHSCYPNSNFDAHSDGKIYVKAIKDIQSGDEITVEYSRDYFGNSNCTCLCKLCCIVNDVVEELIKASINVDDADTEQNVKQLHELSINDRDDDEGADIVGVKTILPGKQMKTLDDMGSHSSLSSSATDDDDDDDGDEAAQVQVNTKQDSFHSSSSSTIDDDDQDPLAIEARRDKFPPSHNIRQSGIVQPSAATKQAEEKKTELKDMGSHSSLSSSATDDDDDDDGDEAAQVQVNTKQDSFHSSSSSTIDDDDQDPLAIEARLNQNIKKRILCKYCPKTFQFKSHWLRHEATHIQGQAEWKCDICQKCFTRQDSMMRHRELHERRYVYHCRHCTKTYYYYESLKQHKKRKHSKKPNVEFECNVCNKAFLSQKTLKYHLNTHAAITPYECPICKQQFSQPYQKSRHIKRMHATH